MKKKYQHIYFDLDRTLWDFDSNSKESLIDLYQEFKLGDFYYSASEFIEIYHKHNDRLWERYREGNLTKETLRYKRFDLTLREKNINDKILALEAGEKYLSLSVSKTILFPNTHEILDYLYKKYDLYILTNGFRETQLSKLRNCDLEKYFKKVFTSETLGYNKPHPEIFHWAVSSINARKDECVMIGDDAKVDIEGAGKYGMDTIFFNPEKEKTLIKSDYEINNLIELKNIL
jgi:putative hydrolase of the HAD superfamily